MGKELISGLSGTVLVAPQEIFLHILEIAIE